MTPSALQAATDYVNENQKIPDTSKKEQQNQRATNNDDEALLLLSSSSSSSASASGRLIAQNRQDEQYMDMNNNDNDDDEVDDDDEHDPSITSSSSSLSSSSSSSSFSLSNPHRGRGASWSHEEESLLQRLYVKHKGDWFAVRHKETRTSHIHGLQHISGYNSNIYERMIL